MEEFTKVENLVDNVREYVHVRVDEVRLGLAERSSGVIAFLVAGAVVTGIFVICFIFICIGAALFLGRLLDNLIAGFAIVALFQLLVGLVLWAARQRLIRLPVMNVILNQLLQKKNADEEN